LTFNLAGKTVTPFCIDERIAVLLARLGPDAAALLLDAVPIAVSPTVAAALTGRSIPALRLAVDRGELLAYGRVHRRIPLDHLAAWTGRDTPYTGPELTGAVQRLTSNNSQHRTPAPPPPVDGDDDGGRTEAPR
jgi:hypothetical protein